MAYQLDPDLVAITAGAPPRTPARRDDWRSLREMSDTALALIDSLLPEHDEVARTERGCRQVGAVRSDDRSGVRLQRRGENLDVSAVGSTNPWRAGRRAVATRARRVRNEAGTSGT